MRWRGRRQSDNIEDRRGSPAPSTGSGLPGGGMLRLVPLLFRLFGVKGGIVALLALGAFSYFGGDLGSLVGGSGATPDLSQRSAPPARQSAEEQTLVDFISVVLADTEDTWHALFQEQGGTYREPRLVLFRGAVQSACGLGQAAMGPFYCPGDQKVYIDLSFYRDLRERYQAPGDFAQAYVVAHEVGHHVQTLLGISQRAHEAKQGLSEVEANRISVRQELQADCFAGIWAYHANRTRQLLEAGDVDEALTAASAIGDDRLQQQSRGYVSPDSFTHGSSAQRIRWFKTGLENGSLERCNTFATDTL